MLPRILIFSQRNIAEGVLFRCPHYEFEEIVCQVDSVDVLAPLPTNWFKYGNRIANRLAQDTTIALNPGIEKVKLEKNYDLFFVICGFPKDLLSLHAVPNWKDHCKVSICLLDEIWANRLSNYECFVKILSQFDYVMLYYSQTVKPLGEIIGDKCSFLPPGVDTLRFCPYPVRPKRVVDVYSIGRRSEVTHQALLRMANEQGMFYVYDSMQADNAINAREHRLLVASVAKRSQYFIVNPGLIDKPEIRGDQLEIGNRFFEGAAAGAIMLGEYPRNGEFERLFDWRDAVIRLPFNSGNIGAVINAINEDPRRKEIIRRTSVVQSLLRHDWVYRWESILKTAGLEPMPELLKRKERLRDLSVRIENDYGETLRT